jgi:hypothetical protein
MPNLKKTRFPIQRVSLLHEIGEAFGTEASELLVESVKMD